MSSNYYNLPSKRDDESLSDCGLTPAAFMRRFSSLSSGVVVAYGNGAHPYPGKQPLLAAPSEPAVDRAVATAVGRAADQHAVAALKDKAAVVLSVARHLNFNLGF